MTGMCRSVFAELVEVTSWSPVAIPPAHRVAKLLLASRPSAVRLPAARHRRRAC